MGFGEPALVESNPEVYVENAIRIIRETVRDRFAISAVSGGVDSAVATMIAWLALNDALRPVFIDTGYMRLGEVEQVKDFYGKMGLEIDILDAQETFYKATMGLCDAEEKRKALREVFYKVLTSYARSIGASFIVQGTIAPDWIETVGGIKTQHNVLYQIGIRPEERYGVTILEPIANLYKSQVRILARYLGIPEEIHKRQPFPGPGLLVRCVGCCERRKLMVLKLATRIVENELEGAGASQYFAAILSKATPAKIREAPSELSNYKTYSFVEKATGVKGDVRAYGLILGLGGDLDELYRSRERLLKAFNLMGNYTRLLLLIDERMMGDYAIAVRAVKTEDFMTADAFDVDLNKLRTIADKLLGIEDVAQVFYDITPKPPATIEFE